MAEFRHAGWKGWGDLLNQALRLVDELYPAAGFDVVALHVEYLVLALKTNEQQQAFADALRRTVSGRGGEVMTYVHKMIDEGIREGIREGELRGRLHTIQGLLGSEVPWSTIEAATGIDEAAFRCLKQQLDDNGAGRAE